MKNPVLVAEIKKVTHRGVDGPTESTNNSTTDAQTRCKIPTEENETGGFHVIRETLHKQGIPLESVNIILTSWRHSTKKTYKT